MNLNRPLQIRRQIQMQSQRRPPEKQAAATKSKPVRAPGLEEACWIHVHDYGGFGNLFFGAEVEGAA